MNNRLDNILYDCDKMTIPRRAGNFSFTTGKHVEDSRLSKFCTQETDNIFTINSFFLFSFKEIGENFRLSEIIVLCCSYEVLFTYLSIHLFSGRNCPIMISYSVARPTEALENVSRVHSLFFSRLAPTSSRRYHKYALAFHGRHSRRP